jgi:hypothetical protein
VDHVAERRAAGAEPQAEPDVLEQAVAAGAGHVGAPGAAHVDERRRADVEQPERIPVRVVALLEREQRARGAGLVSQRVAAQAIVAAEQSAGTLASSFSVTAPETLAKNLLRFDVAQ